MTDNSTPIDDDESTRNGVRYETWTDRRNGLAFVRADFTDDDADYPTLAEQPDSDADDSAPTALFKTGTVFGSSGIEIIQLSYPYYTGAECVSPRERHFVPDWALATFERHGYEVLDPDELPEDDAEILTDGGPDYPIDVTVTVIATLPVLGRKEYSLTVEITEPSDIHAAQERAETLVPENGEVEDVKVDLDNLDLT